MRKIFPLLFIVLLHTIAQAGTLKGIIKDGKGITLPFATVFVQGATTGTAANAAGDYQLQLAPGTYEITCQYIGYKQASATITIAGNETVTHDFTLPDQSLEMKEIVVKATDEDPAYRIMRKVIGRRAFHLSQLKAFQTSIYLKGVFRTRQSPHKVLGQTVESGEMGLDTAGKGILYLCEEEADYYTQQPNRRRTVVHSVRESGNPGGLGLAELPPVITFYENNVGVFEQINPRGFVSPVADGAIGFYKYKLEGEFKEGRNVIYKIKVTPKRAYEPLFFGYIYIVDEDWAIHSLSLTTTAKYALEKLDTLHIEQVFLPLKHDTWVVKNQRIYPTLQVFGFDIAGNFVTVYDNQKINEPAPDTIFNKKIVSVYDKQANKKDTAYWNDLRPISLENDEARDYHFKDSLMLAEKDPHRIDSIRIHENRLKVMDLILRGKTFNGKNYRQSFSFDPALFIVNYNTVEGLNVSPHFHYMHLLDTGNRITVTTALRYGFGNTHFNGIGSLTYFHNNRAWISKGYNINLEGGKYVFQYNPANPVQPIYNTFSTLFYNDNYLKIYERYDAALNVHRNAGNGFRWQARLNYQHRMPLENTTTYSWGKGDGPVSPNVPDELKAWHYEAHDAAIVRVGASYQPGFKYVQYPDYKLPESSRWPVFSLTYEKGIPGILNSMTDYDKWRFNIAGEQRLKLLGMLSYNLSAGGFLNKNYVGLPDLMHLYGDQVVLASPYLTSFQLAPYYRYSNTAKLYGEAHIEYNLQGLLTNKIPLLRQAQWFFILGTNTFYAGTGNYYTEAFLSVDNLGFKIYRLLRVDFVKSWDGERRNYTGIRIGLRLGSLVRFGNGVNADNEW